MAIRSAGGSEQISVGALSSPQNAITLAVWIKHRIGTGQSFDGIIAKRRVATGEPYVSYILVSSDNDLTLTPYFGISVGATIITTPTGAAITPNQWNLLGGTWVSGGPLNLWINGTIRQQTVGNVTGPILYDNTYATLLLRSEIDAKSCDGDVQMAAIWTRALTQQEWNQLYNSRSLTAPLSIDNTGLVGFWPMDEKGEGVTLVTGDKVYDRGPLALHGTPSSSPVWVSQNYLSNP